MNFISILDAHFLNRGLSGICLRQLTGGAELAATSSWTCWHGDVVSQEDKIQQLLESWCIMQKNK